MKLIKYILFMVLISSTAHTEWELFNRENSIIEGDPYNTVVDYNNIIWFHSAGKLIAIDGEKWTKYDSSDSRFISSITDIKIDTKGDMWFVSNGNIVRHENGEFIKVDSLFDIRFIDFDSENNYWVASKESIFKHQDSNFIEKYRETSDEIVFTKLIIDGKNNIYFSRIFYNDLCQLKDDSTVICYYSQNFKMPENSGLYSSAIDSNGSLWVGSRFQIFNREVENWVLMDTLKTSDNINGRNYRGIVFDKNNIQWVIANNSFLDKSYLFKIDEYIESYTLDTNLLGIDFFNLVLDLDIDFSGNLWVSSTMGLFKFTPITTNMIHSKLNNVSVFPNPADNEVVIEFDEIITSIKIIGINGKLIFADDNVSSSNYYRVDVSDYIKGLYIIEVNGTSFNKMIVE